MACVQIARSGFSPILGLQIGSPNRRLPNSSRLIFRCCRRENDSPAEGKNEPPESLFMKELKRRGMTPTSLLEDSAAGRRPLQEEAEEMDLAEEKGRRPGDGGRGSVKRKGLMSADYEKSLMNQRETSMALNSEGLEGLIPRAKLLLTIGGTFFLGFGPLIFVTVAFFSALYFYFGSSFVHDASKLHITPPAYVDPYALLEDDRFTQRAPRVN